MQLISRGSEPSLDVMKADALTAIRILKAGGSVAVLPFDVSYAIFGHTSLAVERVYELKNRTPTKPDGVVGNWDSLMR